jgi:DNA polymerase I
MVFYVISAGYDRSKNAIYLRLYNEATGKLQEFYDDTFKAYCLADSRETFSGIPVEQISPITKYDALHDQNISIFKGTFENPDLVKITQRIQEQMPEGQNEFDPTRFWENHIKFPMSYVYDKDIKMGMPYDIVNGKLVPYMDKKAEVRTEELLGMFVEKEITRDLIRLFEYPAPNFKRVSLDIEVLNEEKKMPQAEISNMPVICVCLKTYDGKRIAFLLLQEGKPIKRYPNVDELHVFTSEKEMLTALFAFIQSFPIIVTFNGDAFDLMYIRNRAYRFKIPNECIPIELAGRSMIMRGTIHIDLYRFFQINAIRNYAFQGKYKDVSLDTLAKIFLKSSKLNADKRMVGDMDYYDLVNYCMRDAELTYDLSAFDNNLVMNLIMVTSRISRMPMEEVSRKAVGRWIGSFLFALHRKLGYLIPNPTDIASMKGKTTTKAMIEGKQYQGAIVITPKGGIYFAIKVVDFGSLYPSIIKFYNIGYATIECPHEECKTHVFAGLPHWICQKKISLESIFIGSLRDLRLNWYKKESKNKSLKEYERNWYKVVEQTIKVFMNASYGVFASKQQGGTGGFAFHCPSASEEIAGIGRSIIQATIEKAIELGIEVIYGDTDSLMLREQDQTKIKALQDWAFATYKIDLELDKEYRVACFSSRKKNYLGIKTDGEIDIKGLTGKKSHTPKFFKDSFEESKSIIKTIEKPEDVPRVKNEITKLVVESYKKLKERRWDSLEDLAFHVTVSKKLSEYTKSTPQHIKVVHQLERAGYSFETGAVMSFVKTVKMGKNSDGVTALELAKDKNIDVDKYIEFHKSMFEQILDPLGLEYEELLGNTKLTSFMKQ